MPKIVTPKLGSVAEYAKRAAEAAYVTDSPAAARIAALEAENARLREALEKIKDTDRDGWNSGDRHAACVQIARAALDARHD